MKKIFFIIFFLTLMHRVVAQDQHFVDSVVTLIKNDGSREDMEIFFELGFQYGDADHARSLEYFDKGLAIAYTLADSLMIVKFTRLKGQVLLRDGRQSETLAVLLEILPTAKRLGFKREVGFIHTTLGLTYTHMAQFDKGLEHDFRAVDIWRDDNDSSQIAALLLNIGFLHYKVGNFDKAIDYSEKSWSLTARRGGKLQAALSCVNIGTIYVRQGNIPEAQK